MSDRHYETPPGIPALPPLPFAALRRVLLVTLLAFAPAAPAGERFRVIVSTDIGGSDPDDFQSIIQRSGE